MTPNSTPPTQQSGVSAACMEAEVFAMNLLMPETMMYQQCLKLAEAWIPKSEWPVWISRLFGVPKDKAALRLQELRI